MSRWTIDSPRTLSLGKLAVLRVRVISGSVAVLASDDQPSLEVAQVDGQPLLVTHEAGIVTITYEDLQLDGMLSWLHPRRHSASLTVTVPAACPTQLGVVNASATVSGMSAKTTAKTVSGDIALDQVSGTVDAKTVSGSLDARNLDAAIVFSSVTGGLTVAGGTVTQLDARTVSGPVTADIDLRDGAGLRVSTVSGDVTVRVPATCSAQVQLRSGSGRLNSSFGSPSTAPGARSSVLNATLGSGSGSLSVTTRTGDVSLLARDGGRQ